MRIRISHLVQGNEELKDLVVGCGVAPALTGEDRCVKSLTGIGPRLSTACVSTGQAQHLCSRPSSGVTNDRLPKQSGVVLGQNQQVTES